MNEKYGLDNPINDYLDVYRFHHPTLTLSEETKDTLSKLKEDGAVLGIITDGREITQKQKFEALGLEQWIPMEMVMINEDKKYFKPNHWSYDRMMLKCHEKYPYNDFACFYVGDNTEKDFIAPKELGWTTICLLNNGKNIQKQNFNIVEDSLPKYRINNIGEVLDILRL